MYALGTRPLVQYGTAWEYLLADALGSVRQIVDANGNVTLAESYEPYGSVLSSNGTASSIFAYAGEQIDTTGLIYLRARYMNPTLGIFLARDPWSGDQLRPGSMNGWNYANGNPIMYSDPSGRFICFVWSFGTLVCAVAGVVVVIAGGCTSSQPSTTPELALPTDVSLDAKFTGGVNVHYEGNIGYRDSLYLGLGNIASETGIEFTGQANIPAAALSAGATSEMHWVQNIKQTRTRTFEDGVEQKEGNIPAKHLDWVLDTTNPYNYPPPPIDVPRLWTDTQTDSPATPLELGPKDPSYRHGRITHVTIAIPSPKFQMAFSTAISAG